MQPEVIRAFRKTWQPRPRPEQRRTRPALALVPAPTVDEAPYPRVSLMNPLPPPAPAALRAAGRPVWDSSTTGIRLRPQLARCAEAPSCVPPAPVGALDRRRHASDDTDPDLDIISMYTLPPLPEPARSSAATIEIDLAWLEPVPEPARSRDATIEIDLAWLEPVPEPARSRDATIEIDLAWLEPLDESESHAQQACAAAAETTVSAPARARLSLLANVWRGIAAALPVRF